MPEPMPPASKSEHQQAASQENQKRKKNKIKSAAKKEEAETTSKDARAFPKVSLWHECSFFISLQISKPPKPPNLASLLLLTMFLQRVYGHGATVVPFRLQRPEAYDGYPWL